MFHEKLFYGLEPVYLLCCTRVRMTGSLLSKKSIYKTYTVHVCLVFGLILYVIVNSYGHVETVSPQPNHTFCGASLTKQLSSTLYTYFRL